MSKIKKANIIAWFFLTFIVLFLTGCKNEVKVEDIYFDIPDNKQIVLCLGQTFELEDYVVITPSYATNKTYTLTSWNSNVLEVNGNVVKAKEVGNSVLQVVSNMDESKQDTINVVVIESQIELITPEIKFDETKQAFVIESTNMTNVYGFELIVNNNFENPIDIGNATIFELKNFDFDYLDQILRVRVRAYPAEFEKAYLVSDYSNETKIYKPSEVKNINVKNGNLTFDYAGNDAVFDVSVYDETFEQVLATGIGTKSCSLLNLDESFAGKKVKVKITTRLNSESKTQLEQTGVVCQSSTVETEVDVIPGLNILLNGTTLSWPKVQYVNEYEIKLGDDIFNTTSNNFDLTSILDYENKILDGVSYSAQVTPVFPQGVNNLANSNIVSELEFTKIEHANIVADRDKITWNAVENAGFYAISIEVDGNKREFNTTENYFSLDDYDNEAVVNFSIKSVAKNGINCVSSNYVSHTFKKQTAPNLNFENYKLTIQDEVLEQFEICVDDEKQVVTLESELFVLDVSNVDFSAGEHSIQVTHLGNDEFEIASKTEIITFVQLGKLNQEDVKIENGILSIVASEKANVNVQIESLNFDGNSIELNTTDDLDTETYLSSGEHTAKIYLKSKDNNTTVFDYREMIDDAMMVCPAYEIEFNVLSAPTIESFDKSNGALSVVNVGQTNTQFNSINATKTSSTSCVIDLDYGETTNLSIQNIGDGKTNLDSKVLENLTISKLEQPVLDFDKQTSKFTKVEPENVSVLDFVKVSDVEEIVAYDFATAYNDFNGGENVFVLKATAIDNDGTNFYISSKSEPLSVYKIHSNSQIVASDRAIVISNENHLERYDFILRISFDGNQFNFKFDDGVLKDADNDVELDYVYDEDLKTHNVYVFDESYNFVLGTHSGDIEITIQFVSDNDYIVSSDEQSENLSFSNVGSITAENQLLKIENVEGSDTWTKGNYYLLLNENSQSTKVKLWGNDNSEDDFDLRLNNNKIQIKLSEIMDRYPETETISYFVSTDGNLTQKSGLINFVRLNTVALEASKDNSLENNSVVVSFNKIETEVSEPIEYLLQINNQEYGLFLASDIADDEKIEFKLDDCQDESEISVKVVAYSTSEYTSDGRYIVDSKISEELIFEKLETTSNMLVLDDKLYFDEVENAIYYEIEITKSGEKTIFTTDKNEFDLSDIDGTAEITVKAISDDQNLHFTNSNKSQKISVKRSNQPVVAIKEGNFVVTLSQAIKDLIASATEEDSISLFIKNGSLENTIDLKGYVLEGKVNIDATTILRYPASSPIIENVEFTYVLDYHTQENLFVLNSKTLIKQAKGLFTAVNLKKVSDTTNDNLQKIVWDNNPKNVDSNGTKYDVGYVVRFDYLQNGTSYYSSDPKLKYKDSEGNILSISDTALITSNSIFFPYCYDIAEDGTLGENGIVFESGKFEIYIKTIPLDTNADSGLLCVSNYSDQNNMLSVLKMEKPIVEIENGVLIWETNENSTSYQILVSGQEGTDTIVTTTSQFMQYDFTTPKFKDLTGIINVSIKAKSTKANVINSDISDEVMAFRIPEPTDLTIKNGYLVMTSSVYFNKAIFETNDGQIFIMDNSEKLEARLNEMQDNLVDTLLNLNEEISKQDVYFINIDKTGLNINPNNYSIKITLLGTQSIVLGDATIGIINSNPTEMGFKNLTVNQLASNVNQVVAGVLSFNVPSIYDGDGDKIIDVNLNYAFNGVTTDFIKSTAIYKVSINDTEIYCVDYYSFIDYKNANTDSFVEGVDYITQTNKGNLVYTVKCGELEFNVFNENKINFNLDKIYYSSITTTIENGEIIYSADGEKVLSLNEDAYLLTRVYLLGGNVSGSISDGFKGYLNAKSEELHAFVRYQNMSSVTVSSGMIKLEDMRVYDENGENADSPVYRLEFTQINSDGTDGEKFLVYAIHSIDNENLTVGEIVAERKGENPYIIPVQFKDSDMLCDVNKVLPSGTFRVEEKTLAGIGDNSNGVINFLIDAANTSAGSEVKKWTETKFAISSNRLELKLAQASNYGSSDTYEITLSDGTNSCVYQISSADSNVKINTTTNKLIYTIPSSVLDGNNTIVIDSQGTYYIKVRAVGNDNILDSSYYKEDNIDYVFEFEKASGIKNVEIKGGKLVWQAVNNSAYTTALVRITFVDDYAVERLIEFETSGASMTIDSEQCYVYTFLESAYDLKDPITGEKIGSHSIDAGRIYTISVSCMPGSLGNYIMSDPTTINNVIRLDRLTEEQIFAYNGKLTFKQISNAVAYDLTIKNNETSEQWSYTVQASELAQIKIGDEYYYQFDIENELQENFIVGTYSISIKAIGNTEISSKTTTIQDENSLSKLSPVDNLEFSGGEIVWDKNENADGYQIEYVGFETIVIEGSENNSHTVPDSVSGEFEVRVTAIGLGKSKVFNSDSVSLQSTEGTSRPSGAKNLAYSVDKITWEGEQLLSTDKVNVEYTIDYVDVYGTSKNETVTVSGYMSSSTFYTNQTADYGVLTYSNNTYTYTLKQIGTYSNFKVWVSREGTASSVVETLDTIEFNLFESGDGTNETSAYKIKNATQFMNINVKPSAYYSLISDINLSEIENVSEIIQSGLITNTFTGKLSGKENTTTHKLYFALQDEFNFSNLRNFAVFSSIGSGAKISDLAIGEISKPIVINNNLSIDGEVKLSILALSATSAEIDRVSVYAKFVITKTGTYTPTYDMMVAGLVDNAVGTTFDDVYAEVEIQTSGRSSNNAYFAGIVAKANNAVIKNSTNISMKVTTTNGAYADFLGGVVANFEGSSLSLLDGVFSTSAKVDFQNVNTQYLGGLVGYASYANIQDCQSSGTIKYSTLSAGIYGGILGSGKSCVVSSCSNGVEFAITNLATTDSSSIKIGAIVGTMTKESGTASILNCSMADYSLDITQLSPTFVLGICGGKQETGVTISGCTSTN